MSSQPGTNAGPQISDVFPFCQRAQQCQGSGAAAFPSGCQYQALPNALHCLDVPGFRTFSAVLIGTLWVGRVCFLLKKLIAGNFPHSSFSVLSLNIFQDLGVFFPVAVLAGKAIGCFSVLFTQKQLILSGKLIFIFRTCG